MSFKQYSAILLAGVTVFFLAGACKHQIPGQDGNAGGGGTGGGGNGGGGTIPPQVPCSPDTVYFTQQILPILVSNCSVPGCHDAASAQDGVVLTNYQSIMSTGEIEPGDPNDSELYEVITESDPGDRMPRPPQNPLSQQQIQLIYKWIQQGAKNNSCDQICTDTVNVTYSLTVKNIITNKCQGCHSGGSPQAGINLSTYAGLKAEADNGRLWGAVNHNPGYSPMPKNGSKLSICELTQIQKWIGAGSPNN
jgi:hypothetical protein